MLAALIVFVTVAGAFLYNLNRIIRIGRKKTEWQNGNYGYIIGFPMFLTTVVALAVCWFLWWSRADLSSNVLAASAIGVGCGLYFGPLIVGSIIMKCTDKDFPVDGTKDFE
jgi:hypothetical protein